MNIAPIIKSLEELRDIEFRLWSDYHLRAVHSDDGYPLRWADYYDAKVRALDYAITHLKNCERKESK